MIPAGAPLPTPPISGGWPRIAQSQGQFDRARRIADYAADVTGEDRFAELATQLSADPAS